MLNFAILKAWPNYFVIPVIVVFWVVIGVLVAELLGDSPFSENQ